MKLKKLLFSFPDKRDIILVNLYWMQVCLLNGQRKYVLLIKGNLKNIIILYNVLDKKLKYGDANDLEIKKENKYKYNDY